MANDVSGYWGGIYYYPEHHERLPIDLDTSPTPFDAEIHQGGHQISGQITEDNRFDPLAGSLLVAHISGHVIGQIISFEKTYISGGTAAHTLIYRGTLSQNRQEILGSWEAGDVSGTFNMRRDQGVITLKNKQAETVKV